MRDFAKRAFDICFAVVGLLLTWWLIVLAWIAASIDTRANGFFTQRRAGLHGVPFRIIKIRTMRPVRGIDTTVTVRDDPRITRLGRFLRRTKIDELPQLFNVLIGQMSVVGPRPDVPSYAAALSESDRVILSVRPGITGPATLKYRDEEEILAGQPDPQRYNDEVIFPDKIRLNRAYVENHNLLIDLEYISRTIFR